ncbi:MAG: hypothetical protein NWE78_07145 [Candidatus Bathyarchaeota archaeon]|nr:hypothetical protein [Candidatus Bathyarchaeota archaeon]
MPISGRTYFWGEKAKNAPEEPGVYALYDKNSLLIYIGMGSNLRKEFTDCLESDVSSNPCKGEAKYYKRETTSKQEERMKELLEEFKQENGEYPKCNLLSPHITMKKPMPNMEGFYFYTDIGRFLGEVALDLEDFKEKISKIPVESLDFHQERGDFTRWIQDVIKDQELAEVIQALDKSGENLRRELISSLKVRTDPPAKADCPSCGVVLDPIKTWKMAGRPSKKGERLQLTIAYYKCSNCSKPFRRVISKERIEA